MDKEMFERLNYLSEKQYLEGFNNEEREEFTELLHAWNKSTHYNVFNLAEYFKSSVD
ncbi:hypothetical protein [Thalassotalea fusca]